MSTQQHMQIKAGEINVHKSECSAAGYSVWSLFTAEPLQLSTRLAIYCTPKALEQLLYKKKMLYFLSVSPQDYIIDRKSRLKTNRCFYPECNYLSKMMQHHMGQSCRYNVNCKKHNACNHLLCCCAGCSQATEAKFSYFTWSWNQRGEERSKKKKKKGRDLATRSCRKKKKNM